MIPASLQQATHDAIARAKLESVLLVNRMRFASASSFLVFYLIFTLVGQTHLVHSLPAMIVYWLVAVGIYWSAKNYEAARKLSGFGIAVVDLPLLLVIQSINLQHSPEPGAVAAFSSSICVFLTVLAGMTLQLKIVTLTTVVAVLCQVILQVAAGGSATAIMVNGLIIVLAGLFSTHLPLRGIRIVRDAAEQQQHRDALARYFSPGVAEAIETRSELEQGQTCEVTVLFLDLRGFTALSETMGSREVIQLLNEFFALMVGVIFRFGGTLDKYLGDGLMAYFNAPVSQPEHAALAVRAALEMEAELENLNRQRETEGQVALKIGIGIHTGEAVVGTIGAPNRPEYTAVGDTVNVASRLEALTKNYDFSILISESTQDRCKTVVECQELETVTIRGKKKAHRVFTPLRSN